MTTNIITTPCRARTVTDHRHPRYWNDTESKARYIDTGTEVTILTGPASLNGESGWYTAEAPDGEVFLTRAEFVEVIA